VTRPGQAARVSASRAATPRAPRRSSFGAALDPVARSPLTFKTEVIRRRAPWRSLEAVEFATLERVDWFNTGRRLSRTHGVRLLNRLEPIGTIPPAEAEQRYHVKRGDAAMAA
jgi:hypothetical protein